MEAGTENAGKIQGWQKIVVDSISIFFCLFYLYQAGFGTLDPEIHRGGFIALTLILVFATMVMMMEIV